jgi:endonuclease/exonuclease/phosphatase family metal-dependent hydrolase
MRIDRILASAPLTFQRFEVLSGAGSDHLPIAAELTLP